MWKQKLTFHLYNWGTKKREERVTNLEFVYYMTLNIPDFCWYVKQTFNIIIFFSMAISVTTSVRIYCFFQPIVRNSEFTSLCQPFRSISWSNIFYISIYKIPSFCNLIILELNTNIKLISIYDNDKCCWWCQHIDISICSHQNQQACLWIMQRQQIVILHLRLTMSIS